MTRLTPLVGIAYRYPIDNWIRAHLDRFGVLEVTVDHYIYGGIHIRSALESLARQVPIVAHGVGLSIGTDGPLDKAYVREVAHVVRVLRAPSYSEHLAFTCVPGRDLGNLLPLPKTPEIAEWVAEKVRQLRALLPVPFDLENISYLFDWPNSEMSDGRFMTKICQAAGAGVLLDIENVYVNSHNHSFDALATLEEIPSQLVRGMHVGGGFSTGELLVDSHDHAVPTGALDLLGRALTRFQPDTIVLERDDRIEAFDELLTDVEHIRACVAGPPGMTELPSAAPTRPSRRTSVNVPLIERQCALLEFLTNPRAVFDPIALPGLDEKRVGLVRHLSLEKRLEKVRASFPVTLAHLDQPLDLLWADFAAAFPPHDIGRAENAKQFMTFLAALWEHSPPSRGYLPDVARIEFAMTQARGAFEEDVGETEPASLPALRRSRRAQLLDCGYDVRALFCSTPASTEPPPGDVRLVILPPAAEEGDRGDTPRLIQISSELRDALLALDAWQPLDETDPLGIGAPRDVAERLILLGVLEVAMPDTWEESQPKGSPHHD